MNAVQRLTAVGVLAVAAALPAGLNFKLAEDSAWPMGLFKRHVYLPWLASATRCISNEH